MSLDSEQIRSQFTVFRENDPPVYFDSAATAQVPDSVLRATEEYYTQYCGNVHRGVHGVTERATQGYEDARTTVAKFIGAESSQEIVFTRNCTEAINLVARSWASQNLQQGDTIVLSILEHHSNIVPWQQLRAEKGIELQWIDCDDHGELQLDQLKTYLASGSVKLVSITGLSNVLGVRPDLPSIIGKAHDAGAKVLVDAAQLVAHHSVDVAALDCDFLTFSGHKLYGPTGIGVLYAKREILKDMHPFMGGGMMIGSVSQDGFTSADPPARFEAGTPPIAQAIGLAAAIEWVSQFGWEDIEEYERVILQRACSELCSIEGVHILGPEPGPGPERGSGCFCFTIDDVHPHDLTDILGQRGIALRAGHHCAQPLHKRLGLPATTRVSVGLYNTEEEIVKLKEAILEAISILK